MRGLLVTSCLCVALTWVVAALGGQPAHPPRSPRTVRWGWLYLCQRRRSYMGWDGVNKRGSRRRSRRTSRSPSTPSHRRRWQAVMGNNPNWFSPGRQRNGQGQGYPQCGSGAIFRSSRCRGTRTGVPQEVKRKRGRSWLLVSLADGGGMGICVSGRGPLLRKNGSYFYFTKPTNRPVVGEANYTVNFDGRLGSAVISLKRQRAPVSYRKVAGNPGPSGQSGFVFPE